jgi:hypothetical protein
VQIEEGRALALLEKPDLAFVDGQNASAQWIATA